MYGEMVCDVDRAAEFGPLETWSDDSPGELRTFRGITVAICLSAGIWGAVSLAIMLFS
jgi:hypothetical protein